MATPRISLDQWTALVSVVESGSYAKAGERLHKSQSTLTYAIQNLEESLGVKAFEFRGRKAALTPAGEVLYRRGKTLVEEASRLEHAAGELAKGWEAEIRLAVEIVFPTWLLLQCFGEFAKERPETRIELFETVLGGTDEALAARSVDFAICSSVPQGFVGDVLMPVRSSRWRSRRCARRAPRRCRPAPSRTARCASPGAPSRTRRSTAAAARWGRRSRPPGGSRPPSLSPARPRRARGARPPRRASCRAGTGPRPPASGPPCGRGTRTP